MRHIRIIAILTGAVCALAVAAAPAMGSMFVGSNTGKLSGRGYEEIERVEKGEYREYDPEYMQQWHFGVFHINCYAEKSEGELTETETEVLTLKMKFGACGWYPKPNIDLHTGATFGKEGITVKLHANGFVETLENGEEVEYKGEILPSSATVKVKNHICHIKIPAQTIPVRAIKHPEETFSSVMYETIPGKVTKAFPEGQEEILLTNAWKSIKFKFGEEEEDQCANPEASEHEKFEEQIEEGGNSGSYKGRTYVRLNTGNLKFVP
jgi:hypothetical protein